MGVEGLGLKSRKRWDRGLSIEITPELEKWHCMYSQNMDFWYWQSGLELE